MSNLVVTQIYYDGVSANIDFSDGHRAVFEGRVKNPHTSEEGGTRIMHLFHGKEEVVRYNVRLTQEWIGPDDNRIVYQTDAYPQPRIAEYWETAYDYLRNEWFDKQTGTQLAYCFITVCMQDAYHLEILKRGEARNPNPKGTKRSANVSDEALNALWWRKAFADKSNAWLVQSGIPLLKVLFDKGPLTHDELLSILNSMGYKSKLSDDLNYLIQGGYIVKTFKKRFLQQETYYVLADGHSFDTAREAIFMFYDYF